MNDAWLAGILEGEGSFMIRGDGIGVSAQMKDRDVIESIYKIAGVGNYTGPYVYGDKGEVKWCWSTYAMQDAKGVMERVLPYMHSRRSARIRECLAFVETCNNRGMRDLPRGVYKRGKKFCACYAGKHLGTFETAEEAEATYAIARANGKSIQAKVVADSTERKLQATKFTKGA